VEEVAKIKSEGWSRFSSESRERARMMCLPNGINLKTATATSYLSTSSMWQRKVVEDLRRGGRENCQEHRKLDEGNGTGFIEASDPSGSSSRDSPLWINMMSTV